jgi:PTS system mannose-specific IIA component
MVGILLLTHVPLGDAFIQAATHVFRGRPEGLEAIDVYPDQDPADVNRLACEALTRLDLGQGVLVITDMIGGTPSNCTAQLVRSDSVKMIAGLNLPMLLRAITYRHDALDVVTEMALTGGQNGATNVDARIRLSIN